MVSNEADMHHFISYIPHVLWRSSFDNSDDRRPGDQSLGLQLDVQQRAIDVMPILSELTHHSTCRGTAALAYNIYMVPVFIC